MVGDLICIKAGMEVPVDGLVLRSSGVLANESAMTGESHEVKKETMEVCSQRKEDRHEHMEFKRAKTIKNIKRSVDVPSPVLLSGTQITTGEGWFIAIVVGKNSCAGKIAAKLE